MHFVDRPTNHLVTWDHLRRTEYVLRPVIPIYVTGHKINRNVLFRAVLEKCIHPGRLGRGRAAHTNVSIYVFDGLRRMLVELEICGLPGIPCPEIKVGFVPYLEIPLRDLVRSITTYQMGYK